MVELSDFGFTHDCPHQKWWEVRHPPTLSRFPRPKLFTQIPPTAGMLRTAGGCVHVALCHVASIQGPPSAPSSNTTGDAAPDWSHLLAGATPGAGQHDVVTLRAAVAPHVALQLLPDARPLLPRMHGYVVLASPHAGELRVFVVYDLLRKSLADVIARLPGSRILSPVAVRSRAHTAMPLCEPHHRRTPHACAAHMAHSSSLACCRPRRHAVTHHT